MQSLFNSRLWKAFDSMQTHAVVRKRISLNSLGFCYLTAEKTLFKIHWNIHTVKSIMFWRFSWGLKGLLKSSVNDVEPILKSRTLYSNNLQYTQIGKCLLISLPYLLEKSCVIDFLEFLLAELKFVQEKHQN